MSRAEELRAQEARRQARRSTADDDSAPVHRAAAPAVRARPVRKTVDLSPARYAALIAWCSETAVQLGTSRITGQQVLSTLVARLLTDETLARKLRDDLAADLASG